VGSGRCRRKRIAQFESDSTATAARNRTELRWFLWIALCLRLPGYRPPGIGLRAFGSKPMERCDAVRRICACRRRSWQFYACCWRVPAKLFPPIELKHVLFDDTPASSGSVSKCVAWLRVILQPIDCIQKVYKRGFRIAADVRVDAPLPPGTLPRLAILPLVAGYGVPEHLGLGVAEYATERLSSARDAIATIVARDSVLTLARRGLSPQEIGRTLDADLVLTGRLEAAPRHNRLRAEMIRVEDGAQLWVEDRIAVRPQIGDLTFALVDLVTWRLRSNGPSISRLAYPI
jgi:TolB-like protein